MCSAQHCASKNRSYRNLIEKFYLELGFESLRNRKCLWRMFYLYKTFKTKLPPYLYESFSHFYRLLLLNRINWILILRTVIYMQFFAKSFQFLSDLSEIVYTVFSIYDPFGVRLINRLRLGFSHLREHKFIHNFADTVNSLCL